MDSKHSVASPFPRIAPESSSPEAEAPGQPSPEPQTPDDQLFSSFWGYSSPMLDPIPQTATSSTVTVSLPSTPSTTSSIAPSSPNYMQHYTIPASAMDAQDIPTPASPSRMPNGKQKKIPRPPNAFMIFRSWLIRGGKLPPGVEKHQQNVSKIAGKAWNLLDEASKDVWREIASERLEDHKKNSPGYKFDTSSETCRTGLEKIRKAVKDSDDDTARRLKALSDVYARDHRAVGLTASQRSRRGRTSPYRLPTAPRTPQKSARGFKTPQLMTGSQLAPPSASSLSLINFDSLSPSSVQSLSPLPLHTQLDAFTQEMAQQPLPYTFLPPGLPGRFEQAHQQQNETIAFADNYAPVNPLAPPSGWYSVDHTGIVPPVVNTSGMMTNTTSNNTATMLGLYELNPPYAHFNPNLGASEDDSPSVQAPVPQTANTLSTPLSTGLLTPREQEVFGAILGNSQLPFTLDNLIPLPFSLLENGFVAGSPSAATPNSPSPFFTGSAPHTKISSAKP